MSFAESQTHPAKRKLRKLLLRGPPDALGQQLAVVLVAKSFLAVSQLKIDHPRLPLSPCPAKWFAAFRMAGRNQRRDIARNAELGEKVVRKLTLRQMPPKDAPRPAERSYDEVVSVLESSLDAAAAKNLKFFSAMSTF